MLFVSVEDFLTQASAIPRLSRDEEKALALRQCITRCLADRP